jgi:hypothetical protein
VGLRIVKELLLNKKLGFCSAEFIQEKFYISSKSWLYSHYEIFDNHSCAKYALHLEMQKYDRL